MSQFISLSKKILLYPYYVSFLFLVVAIIDTFFFSGTVKKILPKDLSSVIIYYALFEFPHILASFFMLGDKEYRVSFKKILTRNVYLLMACAFFVILFNLELFFILYIGYTLYHAVRQQFGIAKMYRLSPSRFLTVLQYIFISTGMTALLGMTIPIPKIIYEICLFIVVISIVTYFLYEKENKKNIYLTMYVLSFAASGILYGTGYLFFGLLSMRVVHDITAFMFYSTHGYNRKLEAYNFIYSSFLTKKINPLYLTPILAISINLILLYIVHMTLNVVMIQIVLLSIYLGGGMVHYNMEGSIWKNGSIARRYIQVT